MTVLKQKLDTSVDISVSPAFAEAHVRFEDENSQQCVVTFDIESATKVVSVFDDKTELSYRLPLKPQSKVWSFIEACTNTAISYALGLIIGHFVYAYYQLPIDFLLNMKITGTFLAIGILRHYLIRRWFNYMGNKT